MQGGCYTKDMTNTERYSDEALRDAQTGPSKGWARAAGYLLQLPRELRAKADAEGTVYANVNPGYRYADGVDVVVKRFLTGDTRTPLTDWNYSLVEQERTDRRNLAKIY